MKRTTVRKFFTLVKIFGGIFAISFIVGGYYGCRARQNQDVLALVKQNMVLEFDTVFHRYYALYKCRGSNYMVLNFDDNKVEVYDEKQFYDLSQTFHKRLETPLIMSGTFAAGYLAGNSTVTKGIVNELKAANMPQKVWVAIAGVLSGYTVGFNCFYSEMPPCNSPKVLEFMASGDNRHNVKQFIIDHTISNIRIGGFYFDHSKAVPMHRLSVSELLRVCDTMSLFRKYGEEDIRRCDTLKNRAVAAMEDAANFTSQHFSDMYAWNLLLMRVLADSAVLAKGYEPLRFQVKVGKVNGQ